MRNYFAIVHKDADSAFGVHFPDLPGCFSAGETEDEAFENACVALRLYAEADEDLPAPRKMVALQKDGEVRKELAEGAYLICVPLVVADRKQRYNVMLDKSLVSTVDHAAERAGINRSEYIAQALVNHLHATTGAVVIKSKGSGHRARRKVA